LYLPFFFAFIKLCIVIIHNFNKGKKKGKYKIVPALNLNLTNYLALLPLEQVAAAQITRPNAILLIKSAKL